MKRQPTTSEMILIVLAGVLFFSSNLIVGIASFILFGILWGEKR